MSDANGHSADPTAPKEVLPYIVETEWAIAQVRLNDGTLVVLVRINTPTGSHFTFWPDDSAAKLGERLLELGLATADGRHLAEEEAQQQF